MRVSGRSVHLSCACLCGLVFSGVSRGQVGPRTSDAEFFAALDLSQPALAEVRRAVEAGNLEQACGAFGAHLLNRDFPKWYYDGRTRPAPTTVPAEVKLDRADRFARNELWSVDVWHAFGDDIDWTKNPTHNAYREYTWQLNRHGFWREMAQAYWYTGEAKYARAFTAQLRDWVADNPVPVEKADQGTGSRWRTIEAGIRMGQSWPETFYRFLHAPEFTARDKCLMVKSFAEHARYLMKFPTSANWLMMESCGLYHVGAMFPEFKEAAAWRDTAIQRLYDELAIQVYPDGAQFELSTSYHQATLKNAEWALRLAQLNRYPVPAEFLSRMERMCDFNLYMARPDYCLPGLNDGDNRTMVDYMQDAFELFPERQDYLFLASEGKRGRAPEKTSVAFPYAGFLVMRSGWDAQARWAMLEAGPFGAAHQHEDKLQLIIHAYGKYLLVDPGSYHYDTSRWRQYIWSGYAHNVLLIDGMEQYRRGQDRKHYVVKEPLAHAWISNSVLDYAAGSYGRNADERYGSKRELPAVWTRKVLYVKDPKPQTEVPREYWLVVDELDPQDGGEHRYEAMFHLDVPDVEIQDGAHVRTLNGGGANLAFIPPEGNAYAVRVVKGQEEPYVQGWLPAGGYDVRPIPTVYYEQSGPGFRRFVYVLYPTPAGTPLPVDSVRAREVEPGTNGPSLQVEVRFRDGRADEIALDRVPQVKRR